MAIIRITIKGRGQTYEVGKAYTTTSGDRHIVDRIVYKDGAYTVVNTKRGSVYIGACDIDPHSVVRN